jgi:hypothetical protein
LEESIKNPDGRYLGYWYSWVIELFIRFLRPILTLDEIKTEDPVTKVVTIKKNMWMNEPWFGLVNYAIVGGPVSLFGVKLQIDTGKQVDANDYPRRAVLYLGWVVVMGHEINNLIPLIPSKKFFGENGDALMTDASIGVTIIQRTSQLISNNILIAYKVVGMLSSSFQPKVDSDNK